MLQPRPSVALVGAKRAGFRYNRRDIQFDEPFEAVSPADADILVKAKLARYANATAAGGDDRSSIATRDAGIPTTPRAMAEKIDRELAPGAPPIPEPEPVVLKGRGGVDVDVPELRANDLEAPPNPPKKRVRKSRARKPVVGDPPAQS